jgi:hypothetical protein
VSACSFANCSSCEAWFNVHLNNSVDSQLQLLAVINYVYTIWQKPPSITVMVATKQQKECAASN